MIFKKAGGKKKRRTWKWKERETEEVKAFKYLRFTKKRNNGNKEHIKAQI